MKRNRTSVGRYHNGGHVTWGVVVFDENREVIAEFTGFDTEEAAREAGTLYQEPAPEEQISCPREANYPLHRYVSCRSAFCTRSKLKAEADALETFVLLAAEPGYDVRSRSEFGGTLTLYRYTDDSPTGVLAVAMIDDNRYHRELLGALGVTVHMGAY